MSAVCVCVCEHSVCVAVFSKGSDVAVALRTCPKHHIRALAPTRNTWPCDHASLLNFVLGVPPEHRHRVLLGMIAGMFDDDSSSFPSAMFLLWHRACGGLPRRPGCSPAHCDRMHCVS